MSPFTISGTSPRILYDSKIYGDYIYTCGRYQPTATRSGWYIEKRSVATGALDPGFGSGGAVSYDQGTYSVYGFAMASDGTYLYVVSFVDGSYYGVFKLALSNGAMDAGFGTNGKLGVAGLVPYNGSGGMLGIVVQGGTIYLAGSEAGATTTVVIKALSTVSGALVATFGVNGTVTEDIVAGQGDYACTLYCDGSVLYVAGVTKEAGTGIPRWFVEKRALDTGALIGSFGTGGQTIFKYPGAGVTGGLVIERILLAEGQLYIIGFMNNGTTNLGAILKVDATTGVVDTNFGTSGAKLSDTATKTTWYNAVAYAGGNLYLSGKAGNTNLLLEKRSAATGALVTDFAGTGFVNLVQNGSYGTGVHYLNGNLLFVSGYNAASPAPARWYTRYELRVGEDLAPSTCTGAVAHTWTDPVLTAASSRIRKVHIDELRTAINARRIDAGLAACAFTDPTLTAGTTRIRKAHLDELRTCLAAVFTACGQAAPTWTDTLTAGTTRLRAVHIEELRSKADSVP